MSRLRNFTTLAVAVTLVVTIAGGCSNDEDETTSTSTTSTSSTTSASTSDTSTPTTVAAATFAVTVKGGNVQPSPTRRDVRRGDTVTVEVTSDVAEEVHVHGYDKAVDIQPGVAGRVTFVADVPGIFEVELERSHRKLLELAVR